MSVNELHGQIHPHLTAFEGIRTSDVYRAEDLWHRLCIAFESEFGSSDFLSESSSIVLAELRTFLRELPNL